MYVNLYMKNKKHRMVHFKLLILVFYESDFGHLCLYFSYTNLHTCI